jgi:hypothetical protein
MAVHLITLTLSCNEVSYTYYRLTYVGGNAGLSLP